MIGEKVLQFLERGRQADEVEVNAAQQNFLAGFRAGDEPALFKFGNEEGIDGVANDP